MRLIDADEFKKQIAGMAIVNNYPADKANKMCELIDCQTTAYDPMKVINAIDGAVPGITNMQLNMIYVIVKSGGIE